MKTMNGSFRFAGDLFPELARLQQHLDEVFPSGLSTNIRALARGGFPAVNVGTSPETVEILAFAPGVDPKALQITVDKGLLVISGERATDATTRADGNGQEQNKGQGQGGQVVYAQERFAGSFRRVVSLPDDADPAKVDARLRDGVLHITVAKRESSRPRQITVN
jgi:HSP20 family protein